MNLTASFDLAIAAWSFGLLPSDNLPKLAMEALEQGIESPTLLELASADCSPNPDLHRLFERALNELGRTRLEKVEAGRFIANYYASQICSQYILPIEGARLIWRLEQECPELSQELGIFAGRVSEYEGVPLASRKHISDLIVADAHALIGKRE